MLNLLHQLLCFYGQKRKIFSIRFIEIVSSFNPLFSDHNHQPAQKTAHCKMDVFHPPGVEKNGHKKNIAKNQNYRFTSQQLQTLTIIIV